MRIKFFGIQTSKLVCFSSCRFILLLRSCCIFIKPHARPKTPFEAHTHIRMHIYTYTNAYIVIQLEETYCKRCA